MRTGLVASAVGHVLILVWGLIALPDAEQFDAPNLEAMPVDLVPITEIDQLRKGVREAKPQEVARAEPVKKPAEKPVEAKEEAKKPVEAAPTPPPAPDPAPQPEPEPEPKKAEEPAPAPAPQEPEPPKEAEVKPVEEAPAPEPVKVTPRTKPTPPEPVKVAAATPDEKKAPDQKKPKFDPNNISALLNKVEPKAASNEQSEGPASLGSRNSTETGQLSASEIALLISKIKQRLSYYGDDYPDDLHVTVQFSLSRDGRLVGQPEVINNYPHPKFGTLAGATVRAIYRVDQEETFAFLPQDKYGGAGGWGTVVINFFPKQGV